MVHPMIWLLGLIFKPLFLILLFGSARLAAWGIGKALPEGKLKKWLFQEKGGF